MREILDLKWAHVDTGARPVATARQKTGKKTIVLAAPSMAVLTALPRVGQYVIAGEDPNKPRASLRPTWSSGVQTRRSVRRATCTIFVIASPASALALAWAYQ